MIEYHEFDMASFYDKKEDSELWRIANLTQVVGKHGQCCHGSIIPRREQAVVYHKVKKTRDRTKRDLINRRDYDALKTLDYSLDILRAEFEFNQRCDIENFQEKQNALCHEASQILLSSAVRGINIIQSTAEKEHSRLLHELGHNHEIDRNNLDIKLRAHLRPRIKYSSKVLQLETIESCMVRAHRYDDATSIRHVLNDLREKEEKMHIIEHERKLEKEYESFERSCASEKIRLEKKFLSAQQNSKRKGNQKIQNVASSLNNLLNDMNHAHILISQRKLELSIEPSPNWKRRAHFGTSSTFHGQHLKNRVKDQQKGGQFDILKLTSFHDFNANLDGTVTLPA